MTWACVRLGRSKAPVSVDPDKKYIRRVPMEQLKVRRQLLDRVVAERAPEVHVIGEVSHGVGFGSGVSCRCVWMRVCAYMCACPSWLPRAEAYRGSVCGVGC